MGVSEDDSVPLWWVIVFLLLALGAGAAVVFAVGGSLVFVSLPAIPAA